MKDRNILVPCTSCKDKFYCPYCIKHWYSEEDIGERCPFCRGNCNCNVCLHLSGTIETSKRLIRHPEKIRHLRYLVVSLLPFVRQIRKEQAAEIDIEAEIQGALYHKFQFMNFNLKFNVHSHHISYGMTIAKV